MHDASHFNVQRPTKVEGVKIKDFTSQKKLNASAQTPGILPVFEESI